MLLFSSKTPSGKPSLDCMFWLVKPVNVTLDCKIYFLNTSSIKELKIGSLS